MLESAREEHNGTLHTQIKSIEKEEILSKQNQPIKSYLLSLLTNIVKVMTRKKSINYNPLEQLKEMLESDSDLFKKYQHEILNTVYESRLSGFLGFLVKKGWQERIIRYVERSIQKKAGDFDKLKFFLSPCQINELDGRSKLALLISTSHSSHFIDLIHYLVKEQKFNILDYSYPFKENLGKYKDISELSSIMGFTDNDHFLSIFSSFFLHIYRKFDEEKAKRYKRTNLATDQDSTIFVSRLKGKPLAEGSINPALDVFHHILSDIAHKLEENSDGKEKALKSYHQFIIADIYLIFNI